MHHLRGKKPCMLYRITEGGGGGWGKRGDYEFNEANMHLFTHTLSYEYLSVFFLAFSICLFLLSFCARGAQSPPAATRHISYSLIPVRSFPIFVQSPHTFIEIATIITFIALFGGSLHASVFFLLHCFRDRKLAFLQRRVEAVFRRIGKIKI